MIDISKTFSGFSTDDIAAAKVFYAEKLGLSVTESNGMLHLDLGGGREHLIYPKPQHEPASYTALNFPTSDIETAVSELRERGVVFESYPGVDEDGIMRQGGPRIAWFKDPAGNILSVLEQA
ncbi:catechol 2,3-dioxygenase-like lactoylglutathione lyase family enzyme [Psychromicrobium silvestre]|uniref:Catechol 2,3-dioxygenase-like lactoylglutathione lyase family enzyme n=1 Tax=Psychromicrobium silvestre TaxID=1645614 RepID=A0A7Y9S5F6_9MICC|nr:VOC family protein [Psychromicrobium silvestre]NYE94475.1 catechol 2,3-dioxygenase-like lactoylglutathione lyase family enzyme [Psychromicrobium silvestre]